MGKPLEGFRVVSPAPGRKGVKPEMDEKSADPIYLSPGSASPTYSPVALRMACVDLVSRGLLHDEGIGRLGSRPLDFLIPTDLAEWFSAWVQLATPARKESLP